MKAILILTDFSENATHAAISSAIFVEKLHTDVFLYHTYYDSPVISAYARGSMMVDEFSLLKKESLVKLNQLTIDLRSAITDYTIQDFHPVINYQCSEGALGSNVSLILEEKEIEMIVMGASSRSTVHNLVFGSDTLSVIQNSSCPVLVIPAKAEIEEIKKITLATAFELEDINAINYLVELGKIFKCDLEIVHVSLLGESENQMKGKAIQTHINALKQSNISYREIRGTDAIKRLNHLCKENKSDVLAIVHYEHGFFSNIFKKSNAEKALLSHDIPLMIIPSGIEK